MGNQQSRSTDPTSRSNPHSPSVTASHAQAFAGYGHGHGHGHNDSWKSLPRRRESIPALSTVRAAAAPPEASLASAAALTSSSTSSSRTQHSRNRSQTLNPSTVAAAHTLRAAQAQDSLKSASEERMGNEQSKKAHAPAHTSISTPSHTPTPAHDIIPPKAKSTEKDRPTPTPSPAPAPTPIDVPAVPHNNRTEAASSIDPADASQENFIVPSSHYSRPPRLPLPIEEEETTPGSPIISPADVASPIDHGEIEGALPRRSSMLSSTTAADEDELADEFKGPQGQPTVPTVIEWEGPGERVYVTGTFAGWNRKYKLHPNGPSKKKDALSAYVHITPGTHHLMFIVDNDMRTSDKLPTAVDYTNILVNYLEVSYDDVVKPDTESPAGKKKESIPVEELPPPPGIYPPQTLPPTPELQPIQQPVPDAKPKVPPPSPTKYHQNIPRYLLDLDAPEESRRFARANAVGANLPTPPTLPMFLSKSILNGTTPMKDDSSVLIMPNHTVLNHLATSSIKDNILATSATTRYKQKFLTTIMYKPKNEDPDREH